MQQCLCTDYKNFDAVTAFGGLKGQEVFHQRSKSFTCVSVPGSIPGGPAKKSLGGDAMRGMILKIFLGFLASKCRTAFSGENRSRAFEMVATVWTSF